MTEADRTAGAASFDAVAGIYASVRPSYPPAAVEWLVGSGDDTIADVGAGTGIFTRLLLGRARRIVAVEPSAAMLAELREQLPGIEAVQGSGERMPLPDASADVVTFAQSWHWVDVDAASAEVARVLRPGGRLVLVWNLRDERVPWVRELGTAMRADGDHYRGEQNDPAVAEMFGEPERSHVEWVRNCTPAEIVADVRSRSYFPLLSDGEQSDVVRAIGEVLDRQARGGTVALPYVTASFRYDLR
jgi:SAM-dependent methyltransferase